MELPIGFRVSGCFGTKHPINSGLKAYTYNTRGNTCVIMRGDYYVVPPNSAHVGRCVRESLACAHASGPDAKQKASPEESFVTIYN